MTISNGLPPSWYVAQIMYIFNIYLKWFTVLELLVDTKTNREISMCITITIHAQQRVDRDLLYARTHFTRSRLIWHIGVYWPICVHKAAIAIQFNWTHFAVAASLLWREKKSLGIVILTSNNHHIKYQVWTDVEGTCCGNVQRILHHFTVWTAAVPASVAAVVPLLRFVHFNSFSSTTTATT